MITSFFKPKRSRAEDSNADKQQRDDKKIKSTAHPPATNGANVTPNEKKGSILAPQVMQLISYLDQSSENSWRHALDHHFSSPSFARLAAFVESQRKCHVVFPPPQDTFSALNWTPLDKVKVVIVGQDPYHGPNQAHGLCFSVHRGQQIPPSLRNIYKELMDDPMIDNFQSMPRHGYLERWALQGVLMINTVLTVRKGEANSHQKKGWEEFTDHIIRAVDRKCKQQQSTEGKKKGVVFLLWGKPATNKTQTALSGTSTSRHAIIATSHPSPLGATKTNSPFLGSKCFSRCNEALRAMGYDDVDWRVDGPLPNA
jgi:uracil-DNA glycosylase